MKLSTDIGTLTKQIRAKFFHRESLARFTPQTVDQDWKRLVIVSFVCLVTLFLVSGYLFIRIKNGESINGETVQQESAVLSINKDDLSLWAQRMMKRQEYESEINLSDFTESPQEEETIDTATTSPSTQASEYDTPSPDPRSSTSTVQ